MLKITRYRLRFKPPNPLGTYIPPRAAGAVVASARAGLCSPEEPLALDLIDSEFPASLAPGAFLPIQEGNAGQSGTAEPGARKDEGTTCSVTPDSIGVALWSVSLPLRSDLS